MYLQVLATHLNRCVNVYQGEHQILSSLGCLQRKDLLQLMIDASDSEMQTGIEKGEIIADSVGFILAGYETTSTALTFATYLLATNPEAQERLANEVHEYLEQNPVSGNFSSCRVYIFNYAILITDQCGTIMSVCFSRSGQVHV